MAPAAIEVPTRVDRAISALFCDDVRHELGGKITVVGLYQQIATFPAFPARLPRLSVVLSLTVPKTRQFEHATFKIYRDAELEGEVHVPGPKDWEPNSDVLTYVSIGSMDNVVIQKECCIRVRCVFDDGEVLATPALLLRIGHT